MKSKALIITSLIIAVIIISLSIGATLPPRFATLPEDAAPTQAQQIVKSVTEKDTDGDGLKDWEESLWGTDSSNPDTDGDGTTDGEEITMNRNPAVKGPSDSLAVAAEDLEKNKLKAIKQDLTATEKFSQDLFAKYLALKQQGLPLDADTQNTLIQSVLSNVANQTFESYNRSDVRIIDNTNKETVKDYGNSVGLIIFKNSPQNTENELVILQNALTLEDEDELLKLQPIIDGYKSILKDLLALPVPANLAVDHLAFVNSINSIEKAIEAMKNGYSDPIGLTIVMNDYSKKIDTLKLAITNIKITFSGLGIDYSSKEPGYILVNTF